MIQLTTKDADFIAGVIKEDLKGLLNSFDDYKKDVENKAGQIKALKSMLPESAITEGLKQAEIEATKSIQKNVDFFNKKIASLQQCLVILMGLQNK